MDSTIRILSSQSDISDAETPRHAPLNRQPAQSVTGQRGQSPPAVLDAALESYI